MDDMAWPPSGFASTHDGYDTIPSRQPLCARSTQPVHTTANSHSPVAAGNHHCASSRCRALFREVPLADGRARPRQPRFNQWAKVARSRPRLAKFSDVVVLNAFFLGFSLLPPPETSPRCRLAKPHFLPPSFSTLSAVGSAGSRTLFCGLFLSDGVFGSGKWGIWSGREQETNVLDRNWLFGRNTRRDEHYTI